MALPVIANVFRVTLNWSAAALVANNVMHFRSTTLSSQQVLDAIDASVTGNMWAPSALGAVVGTIEALKLDGVSASVSKAVAGAKWTGQTTGDLIPSGAMVVTLRSALRGRRTRGRVFVPFVAEANNLNGVLVASNLALAQTAWTNFMGAMTTANAEFVIASYLGSFGTTVTSVTCQPIMATQRRRQSQLR